MRRLLLLCCLAGPAPTQAQPAPPAVPVLMAPSSLPPDWSYGCRYPQPLLLSASLLPLETAAYLAACACPSGQASGIDWQALPPYLPRYAPQRPAPQHWLGLPYPEPR